MLSAAEAVCSGHEASCWSSE